jgi:hypothetical protein
MLGSFFDLNGIVQANIEQNVAHALLGQLFNVVRARRAVQNHRALLYINNQFTDALGAFQHALL